MMKHRLGKISVLFIVCIAAAIGASAQTLTTLVSFDTSNGASPIGPLVQSTNGNFYGTTSSGGLNGGGTIFKITSAGQLRTLHSFCGQTTCPQGAFPSAGLAQGADGNFYGTTYFGGADNLGTIFKMSPSGTLQRLYQFLSFSLDGANPVGSLVQGADGNFYGTATAGGENGESCPDAGCGTLFKISPGGKFTLIYTFCRLTNCVDGGLPQTGLLQAPNGDFYGSTNLGGLYGSGTIFVITPVGKLTTLHQFGEFGFGSSATSSLILGTDGNLYGTTYTGGTHNKGQVFQLTPNGHFQTLYNFKYCPQSCTDGSLPNGLVQGNDGNFYGTTQQGGAANEGTIFMMTLAGQLTTLYSFCVQTNCPDGSWPALPIQSTNGNFYGVTSGGGANKDGTVFSFSADLAPFVEASPNYGQAGRTVKILGNSLTGTISVTFNGTSAAFTVLSDTYLEATVPAGATTGTIQVTTPSGTLASDVGFQVTQ
jgi:uncharacterized repeat protein (TIGR03803 family)